MKEADGEQVDCPVMLLTAERIEELLDANQLVRDGANKYRPAKSSDDASIKRT
jgi:hypothetical protein